MSDAQNNVDSAAGPSEGASLRPLLQNLLVLLNELTPVVQQLLRTSGPGV
jgi:hypothetical protein